MLNWIITILLLMLMIGVLRYLSSAKSKWESSIPTITRYENGDVIAEVSLTEASGAEASLVSLVRITRGAVIVFLSPSCSACAALLRQVADIVSRSGTHRFSKTLILIALAGVDETRRIASVLGPERADLIVLSDGKGSALSSFGIMVVPVGMVLDADARIVTQGMNPHAGAWIYRMLSISPPPEPLGTEGLDIVVPKVFTGRAAAR